MKKIILFLLILIPFIIFAQQKIELPLKNDDIFYEKVIKIDSASKEQLYQRAKFWFVNAFKDSKNVLETQNIELGQLTGKGSMNTSYAPPFIGTCRIYFTVNLNFKDGKYRYQFYGFTVDPVDPERIMGNQFPLDSIYSMYEDHKGIMYWRFDSKKRKWDRTNTIIVDFNNDMTALISSLNESMKIDANNNW